VRRSETTSWSTTSTARVWNWPHSISSVTDWERVRGLSGSRPVLGLSTYLQQAQTGIWDVRASFLPAIYIDGVNLAGGIAALLPPQRWTLRSPLEFSTAGRTDHHRRTRCRPGRVRPAAASGHRRGHGR